MILNGTHTLPKSPHLLIKPLVFIKRNLSSCTKDTKAAAYTALVRPAIEYCSSVWDPATKELVHEVGKNST